MQQNKYARKKEHQYEKAVLVGLITQHQDEEKLTEYLDELEFLAFTAGATVEKRLLKNYLNQILELL
jgi:GTP-binding protein HflX